MAYRRRRPRGTWFPTLGTQLDAENAFASGFGFGLTVSATDIVTFVCPITTDFPVEGDDITSTTHMSEVIANEYFLDRIVGKLFLQHRPGVEIDTPTTAPVLVAAGFFVARADDTNPQNPVGAGTAAELRDNYSPADWDTIREPWIWRRAWILGANQGSTISGIPNSLASFPAANWQYGSVLDGPHIDAKTKRRVGQDDRLFFAVSAHFMPQFGVGDFLTPPLVQGWLDYRLHGMLRKSRPTGKF